ncbi:hypothetical protein BYT27DRAFT_7253858 [Phlegmacium glaucopus]|nr:hypothetical protein BYT27DRAFT_7253858 [Phlegmacium glaucopus]
MSNTQEMAPAAKGTLALLGLASKLRTQDFRKSGNMSDLNASVGLFYKGISGLPTSSQNYSVALDNLAKTLLLRVQNGGQRDDLDEAISLHRQALKLQPLPHPNRCTTLNNLATVLWMRSTQGGKRSDVDEAISLSRQALELFPSLHPIRSTSFIILANALLTRFQQGGPKCDLDEAISLHRQALNLHPIQIDLRPLPIFQMHCGPDLRKEARKVISMKLLISTYKFSSSDLHPIPFGLFPSTILQTYW